MFGTPVKITNASGEVIFQIEVNVTPIGVEVELVSDGLIYSKEAQSRLTTLQHLVLSELAQQKGLFKNQPTLSALEAITPNWGFVTQTDGIIKFSPYAKLEYSTIAASNLPCLVDIQLKSLEISRSTIRPIFVLHYLGKKSATIDFEWSASPLQTQIVANDLTEVSDLGDESSGDNDVLYLADPAKKAREKAEAKAQIRGAFLAAEEARSNAEELAKTFYKNYDLSDSESAFTEWMSDAETEDETD
jgi:hypothetical protein